MATLTIDHFNDNVASYEGQSTQLPCVEIPTSLTIQTAFGTTGEFFIYSWDDRVEKSRCCDFGDFLIARDMENNLGTEFGIVPCFWCDIRMRDHDDINGIWAEAIRIMRCRVFDEALQPPNSSRHPNVTTNLSRFLQKLELRTGENAEILRDHLKQSKLKVKGFGVDPNSREVLRLLYPLLRVH